MTHQLLDFASDRDHLVELNVAQHWKYQLISRTGILLVKNLTELDTGSYVCVANNSFGQDQLELKLTVKQKLVVQLNNSPTASVSKQSINSIHLKCGILSGYPIQKINWYHDGQAFNQSLYQENDLLTNGASALYSSMIGKQNLHNLHSSKHKIIDNGQQLIINKFETADQGCYTCIVKGGYAAIGQPDLSDSLFAKSKSEFDRSSSFQKGSDEPITLSAPDSVQDSICFQLSEKAPILKKVFSKTVLKQGDKMSLRCIASGNPLPTVQFKIFDTALPENQRYGVKVQNLFV